MQQHRILHIEDSITDADLIKRTLQRSGLSFQYLLASNKEEVLKGLDEFVPDLILCDHSLPSFNSKMAYAICKEKNPDLPFFLVTGTVSEEFAVDMIQTGVDYYLLKSNLQLLPVAISNAFAKRASEEKIKAMRLELQQSEAHLRSIFENSSAGIILLDRDCNILEVNNQANYFTTLSFGSQLKKMDNLIEMLPEYRRQDFADKFAVVLIGEAVNYESTYAQAGGNKLFFLVNMYPIISPNGSISGACMNFEDITQKKKDEETIRQSEILNRSILNSIQSHIAVVDKNGYIMEVNQAWNDFSISNGETMLEKTGKGSNYVTVCNLAEKAGDVLAANALQGFKQVLKKEVSFFEMEYPCHSRDEERWFLLRIVNFEDDSHKVVMMHIDITEIKKAAREMKSLNERLLLATTSGVMGIWDWDIKNDQLLWDEGMYRLYKIDSGLFGSVYKEWISRLHPDDCDRVHEEIQMAIAGKKKYDTAFKIVWQDKSVHHIKATGITESDDNGKVVRMIGLNWDITHQVEEELRVAKAIIDAHEEERNFLGAELHDNVNQILAGSLLTLGIAHASQSDPVKAAHFIKISQEQITDAIDEIRNLSHHLAPVSLGVHSLKELVETLLFSINLDNRYQINFQIDMNEDNHISDEIQINLYRILQEQTKNILKYAKAGYISVNISLLDNTIIMKIIDDGIGFDAKAKNNGIGLNNIRKRAESLAGKFSLNTGPGKGCELLIEIPLG